MGQVVVDCFRLKEWPEIAQITDPNASEQESILLMLGAIVPDPNNPEQFHVIHNPPAQVSWRCHCKTCQVSKLYQNWVLWANDEWLFIQMYLDQNRDIQARPTIRANDNRTWRYFVSLVVNRCTNKAAATRYYNIVRAVDFEKRLHKEVETW